MKLSRESLAGIALLVIVALVTLASWGGKPTQIENSARNKHDDGRWVTYRLLDELGFDSSPWDQPPGLLPRSTGLLVMPAVPETLGMEDEARPLLGHAHDPLAYAEFVERGGTLCVPFSDEALNFVADELGFDVWSGVSYEPSGTAETTSVRLFGDAQFELTWPDSGAFVDFQHAAFDTPIVATDGRVLALAFQHGRGRILLLGSDAFLAKVELSRADNVLVLVELADRYARDGRVLFDDFALGLWDPPSSFELAASGRFGWISLHLAILVGLLIWRHAWVGPFARDPLPLDDVSPLARARAMASLFERGKRPELLVNSLRFGFLRELALRLHVAVPRSALTTVDDDGLREKTAEILNATYSRAGIDGDERAHWEERIFGQPVKRVSDIEHVATALAEFERIATERCEGSLPARAVS